MSQPRRRRRRGRRGGQGAPAASGEATRESAQAPSDGGKSQGNRSRRRRGRGRTGGGGRQSSPKSSEDLVRALPKERPETLTAPPDGQILEDIIGELQSTWGVPPYPQEYRITIKVAEERDSRPDPAEGDGGAGRDRARRERNDQPRPEKPDAERPRREKAPAAPGLASSSGPQREKATRKRRRRRRRGGGGQAPGANPEPGSSDGPPKPSDDEG
jgi:ribonuclease E